MNSKSLMRIKVTLLLFLASSLGIEASGDNFTIDVKEVPHTFQKLESLTAQYAALEVENGNINKRKATHEANLRQTNSTLSRLNNLVRNIQLQITNLESENTSRSARLTEIKSNLLPIEVDNLKNLNEAREEMLPKVASAAKSLKETLTLLASTREEAKNNKDLLAKLKEGTGGPQPTYTATVLSITHRSKPFSNTAGSKKEATRNALEECLKQYSDCELQSVSESLESVAKRELLIEETTKKLRLQQEVYLPRLEEQSQEQAEALEQLKTQSLSITQDSTEAKDRVTLLYQEIKSIEAATKAAQEQITQLTRQQIASTEQIATSENEKSRLLESLKAISIELTTNEAQLKSTFDSKVKVEQRIEQYRYDVTRTARLDGARIGMQSAISYAVSKSRSIIFPQGVQQGKEARAEYCKLLSRRDGYRAGYLSPKEDSTHYQNGLRDGKCQVEAWHRDNTFKETTTLALATLQWKHSDLTHSMDGLLISELEGIEKLEEKVNTLFPDLKFVFDTRMPSVAPEHPEFLIESVPSAPDHRQFQPATLIPPSPIDSLSIGEGDLKSFGHPSLDNLFIQELKTAIVAEVPERLPALVDEQTQAAFAKGYTTGWEEEEASHPCTPDPQFIELGEYDRGLSNSMKEHSEPLQRFAQREALYRVTIDYLAQKDAKTIGAKLAKDFSQSKAKETVYPEGFQKGKSARNEYCKLIGAREGYRKGYFDKERASKAYLSGFEEGKCLAESWHRGEIEKTSSADIGRSAIPGTTHQPSKPQDRAKPSESIPIQSHYHGYKALAQIGSQLLLNPQSLQQGVREPKHQKGKGPTNPSPNPPTPAPKPPLPARETYVRYSEYLTDNKPLPPAEMNVGPQHLPAIPSTASWQSEIQLASQSSHFGSESVNHIYRKVFESTAVRELSELLPNALKEESQLQFVKGYSEGWEDPVAKQGCSPDPLFVELGTYDRAVADGVHESWELARITAQRESRSHLRNIVTSRSSLDVETLWENRFTKVSVIDVGAVLGDELKLKLNFSNRSETLIPSETLRAKITFPDEKKTVEFTLPTLPAATTTPVVVPIEHRILRRKSPNFPPYPFEISIHFVDTTQTELVFEQKGELTVASAEALFHVDRIHAVSNAKTGNPELVLPVKEAARALLKSSPNQWKIESPSISPDGLVYFGNINELPAVFVPLKSSNTLGGNVASYGIIGWGEPSRDPDPRRISFSPITLSTLGARSDIEIFICPKHLQGADKNCRLSTLIESKQTAVSPTMSYSLDDLGDSSPRIGTYIVAEVKKHIPGPGEIHIRVKSTSNAPGVFQELSGCVIEYRDATPGKRYSCRFQTTFSFEFLRKRPPLSHRQEFELLLNGELKQLLQYNVDFKE